MHAEDISLYPYLLSEQLIYPDSRGINLRSYLKVGRSKAIQQDRTVEIRHSTLVITDGTGKTVIEKERAFNIPGHGKKEVYEVKVGSGIHGTAFKLFSFLRPGEYKAFWRVDGRTSNSVAFEILKDTKVEHLPSLRIEPVTHRQGIPNEPLIIVQFVNRTDKGLGLSHSVNGSRLLINGRSMNRIATPWSFPIPLAPGKIWGKFIQLGEYEMKVGPGVHQIEFEFAGRRSNALSMKITQEDLAQ